MSYRLTERRAGVLLHPTSLPGSPLRGDLGQNAYWFVDFLVRCGISVWQTLPLNPTNADWSPYQSASAHAGNTDLICLKTLANAGWLSQEQLHSLRTEHAAALRQAQAGFAQAATVEEHNEYQQFIHQHSYWLGDYALYLALKQQQQDKPWWEWPEPLRDRDSAALRQVQESHAAAIEQARFEQFLFFRQWQALKAYANERNILLFGDIPIFVAADSADVWANRENFLIDETGRPQVVAGVPPDYFSETGQLWGNPHYDWAHLQANGFQWWIERLRTQEQLFDMVRVDHFRGFEAYWEIEYGAETAIDGRWVKAPGQALFETLSAAIELPLIAEDLGIITEEVTALREHFSIPGMKILQFAFGDNATNPYLPHNLEANSVVYTGTHDNNTTLGWFQSLSDEQRTRVYDYLRQQDDMPWALIRAAFASVSCLAIVPMQDLLGCAEEGRMNVPGIAENNWRWRFSWDQVSADLAPSIHHLLSLYGRI